MTCHDNVVTGKGLNLFHDCAVECVHLCLQEEECTSSSLSTVKCTLLAPEQIHRQTDSQTDRTPTKINKNGAVGKVRI